MNDAKPKPSRNELIAMLPTSGWDLSSGKNPPIKNRTLEELARATHERHTKGESAGLISKMEAALELDMVQIHELWEHLGLPM